MVKPWDKRGGVGVLRFGGGEHHGAFQRRSSPVGGWVVPVHLLFRRSYGRSDLAVCAVVSKLERLVGRSVTEGEKGTHE